MAKWFLNPRVIAVLILWDVLAIWVFNVSTVSRAFAVVGLVCYAIVGACRIAEWGTVDHDAASTTEEVDNG